MTPTESNCAACEKWGTLECSLWATIQKSEREIDRGDFIELKTVEDIVKRYGRTNGKNPGP